MVPFFPVKVSVTVLTLVTGGSVGLVTVTVRGISTVVVPFFSVKVSVWVLTLVTTGSVTVTVRGISVV